MGALFRRRLKSGNLGAVWWVQYSVDGRRVRESTRTTSKHEAKRFLQRREGAAARRHPLDLHMMETLFAQQPHEPPVRYAILTGQALKDAKSPLVYVFISEGRSSMSAPPRSAWGARSARISGCATM
jgi:hypothetical protein